MTVLTAHDRRSPLRSTPAWSVQGAIVVVAVAVFLWWLVLFELASF
jgi:type VI protein secretion system component VasF